MHALAVVMSGLSRKPDYEALASNLAALGYAMRLEILDRLRVPHSLSDIEVPPARTAGGGADRASSRQTVRHHLDKLVEVDLVRAESVEQRGRVVQQYSVHPQRLYALTEELRRLSINYVQYGTEDDLTSTVKGPPRTPAVTGPRLVLVHGVYEGKMFALSPRGGEASWTIGRREGVDVELGYDPFVSLENALIVERDGEFTVHDIPGSKNGTSVNWTRLDKGASCPLKPGSVIGVGRSLLCFAVE